MQTEMPQSLASAPIRIMLVDDFEPWRRSISSLLRAEHRQLDVVDEVPDGLTAVHKSHELQPDVILLDIGLPTLNGIAVASRISKIAPNVKIIFLTQNNDADVVDAALSNGAKGYVLKSDAAHDLLPAIGAALRGERFVSERLRS